MSFCPCRNPALPGLTLTVPVVQAPLGVCDGPRLAAAVSRAGGLGTLSLHAPTRDALRRTLARLRRLTPRPVLMALTAPWEPEALLDLCLSQGFFHFQAFWWNSARLTPRIHAAGGFVFSQVGTPAQARDALERGVDALVVQGSSAGGPVRSPFSLEEFVAALRAQTDVPLIAGGGLADRADVERVLSAGAAAALLGTRFLLSDEAAASARDKARLLRAGAEDLLLDTRLIGDWPCSPRRRLQTAFDEDRPALFAGEGVGKIRSVLPAGEIVRRLTPRPPSG